MRIAFVVFALVLVCPAMAEDAGTAEDARKELASTLSAIKESDARQKEIAQKTAKLESELKSLQEEMVAMGKDTSRQEEDLSSYEEKLAILEEQKREKTKAFDARQTELSSMISAMIKLQQLPPEAIIAMPGKLDETLSTARALSIVTHAIEDEAQSLKAQLHELDILESKIHGNRTAIASRETTLSGHQAELAAKMKERNALVEALGGKEREEKEHVAKLTAKSKSLQELVESLQKEDYDVTEHKDSAPKIQQKGNHTLRSFEKAKGHIRMPAAGKIISQFGNSDTTETFSKGIVIETRKDADVVAPYDGQVVFAGPFRDYGSIVIIRHSDAYHTMLSGLDEINCKPGQYLLEGEPIGSMGSGAGIRLYMELREDGKPIDPKVWIKD